MTESTEQNDPQSDKPGEGDSPEGTFENINEQPGNDPNLTEAQNMDDQERHKAGLEPIDRDNPEEPTSQVTPEEQDQEPTSGQTSGDNPAGSTGTKEGGE